MNIPTPTPTPQQAEPPAGPRVVQLRLGRTWADGNYGNQRIDVTIQLPPGTDTAEVIQRAQRALALMDPTEPADEEQAILDLEEAENMTSVEWRQGRYFPDEDEAPDLAQFQADKEREIANAKARLADTRRLIRRRQIGAIELATLQHAPQVTYEGSIMARQMPPKHQNLPCAGTDQA